MVLILDGNSNICARMRENVFFERKKIRFVSALVLCKCLLQIKWHRLLLMYAPVPELPSNINTMKRTGNCVLFASWQIPGRDVISWKFCSLSWYFNQMVAGSSIHPALVRGGHFRIKSYLANLSVSIRNTLRRHGNRGSQPFSTYLYLDLNNNIGIFIAS